MKFKQNLSIVLLMIFTLTSFMPNYASTYADTTISTGTSSGGSSSSGSSGGGGVLVGGGSSVSATVEVSYTQYTAKGTIYLPNGAIAPVGGIDVYGAFGGVSFETPTTFSLMSLTTSETESNTATGSSGGGGSSGSSGSVSISTTKINNTEYEKYGIVATIPYGKNSVSYEYTFKLPSSYKAFYGKFWTLNSNYSNQTVMSNIAIVSSSKTEYTNLNATLSESANLLNGTISLPDNITVDSDIEVYVIADNGYEEFISKTTIKAGKTFCDYLINGVSNSTYKLSYYIPKYNNMGSQILKQGTSICSESLTVNGNTTFDFLLEKSILISGTVSISEDRISQSEPTYIEVFAESRYYGDEKRVICHIPVGETSAYYQIGINEDDKINITYTALNRNDIAEGYNTVYSEYESISDYDIILESVYPIEGTVKLPSDITVNENTYFIVDVCAYNTTTGCIYSAEVQLNDDKLQDNYLIQIPADSATGEYVIYYDYNDVTDVPSTPYNPIKYHGSSSGGGGGGSSGGSSSTNEKTFEIPQNLLQEHKYFITSNGLSIKEKEAEKFKFDNVSENIEITLAKTGDIELLNRLGGYFASAINIDGELPLKVSLINTDTGETQILNFNFNGSMVFYSFDVIDGNYILKYDINNEIFYYDNNRLVSDINNAEILSVLNNTTIYQKDVYYKNTFPTKALAYCVNADNNTAFKLYDITGHLINEYNAYDTFLIPISKFVLGIDNLYFSSFDGKMFSKLTSNFDDAVEANCEYRNYFIGKTYGEFKIDTTYTGETENPNVEGNWLDEGNYVEPVPKGSTFEITTPEELAWVAYKVKTGSTFINKTVKLMNDIDLSAHQWTPIGGWNGTEADDTKCFYGVFNGNSFSINGLTIGSSTEYANYRYCGLFGLINSSAIKNMTLQDIEVYNNGDYTGGVTGMSKNSSTENITLVGNVIGSKITGGIVAKQNSQFLRNCVSYVTVCSNNGNYSGVIAGELNATIENCVSFGQNLSEYSGGGIAGYLYGSATNCYSNTIINNTIGNSNGVFANGYGYNFDNCFYNSDNGIGMQICDSAMQPIAKTTTELKSTDFLNELNNNSNYNWNDWVIDENNLPIPSNINSRLWQPCDYDLVETNNIYTITTAEELAWLANEVNNGETFSEKTFALSADIDLSKKYWIPIGDANNTFNGMFDGQNHTITGLNYNAKSSYLGLFGYVEEGTIKNLKITNVNINAENNVGALCGFTYDSDIENCNASGQITGSENIGGLIGNVGWHSKINNVGFSGTVNGSSNTGGVIGYADYANANQIYFNGNITGNSRVGGIIGWNDGASISNCYSNANIIGQKYVGGLVGYGIASVSKCYSNSNIYGGLYVGGIVGAYYGNNSITSSYWNIEKKQHEDGFTLSNDSKKGVGDGTDTTISLTTEQLAKQTTFEDWDFDNIWCINDGFPIFKNQVKQYDYSISDISVAGNYIVANITKNTDVLDSDKIYFVTYTDGKLTDMICDNLEIEKGTKLVTSSKPLNISTLPNTTVKVFIWNRVLMPLSMPKETIITNK